MRIPESLNWVAQRFDDGQAWLDSLPRLLAELAEQWNLELSEPYDYAFASLAVRATRNGTPVVLKVQYPDREAAFEAAALKYFDGDGAVQLFEYDEKRRALLIERCEPGTALSQNEPDGALNVLIGLLPRLWRPATAPFTPLADEAEHWLQTLEDDWRRRGEPFPRQILDAAINALTNLPPTQGEQVVVNQDLHADNVLAAQREPWLLIDPKPLNGEREFGVVTIVRGTELGHGRSAVLHRLRRLCDELQLDRHRVIGWTIGQSIAWCFTGDGVVQSHVDVATWLLDEL